MRDMDGLDIVVLTDSRPISTNGGILRARSIIINGQEIVALKGAGFSLNAELGAGPLQASFTVLVKSIEFKERDSDGND